LAKQTWQNKFPKTNFEISQDKTPPTTKISQLQNSANYKIRQRKFSQDKNTPRQVLVKLGKQTWQTVE